MEWDFQNLFFTPPIDGVTINTVPLSPSFTSLLYILVAFVFIFGIIIFLTRKYHLPAAIKKAAVISFFSAGIVYTVHADFGWSTWITNDRRDFAGLTTEEKLSRMDRGLYDFTVSARKVIDDDYMLFSSDGYQSLRAEYFLLPLRKRDQAKYIVVLTDSETSYDPAARIFTSRDVRIGRVEPVLGLARNAYILKRNP